MRRQWLRTGWPSGGEQGQKAGKAILMIVSAEILIPAYPDCCVRSQRRSEDVENHRCGHDSGMPRCRRAGSDAALRLPGRSHGKLLIERVTVQIVDAQVSGYCGFGDPAANSVDAERTQVQLAGVPQRTKSADWHSDTIDLAQAIVVDASSAYTIRVAGDAARLRPRRR